MLLFRTFAYYRRWAKFAYKAVAVWGIAPGRNVQEMRANLENSVLRFEAAAFHRESAALQAEWRKLFGGKQ